MRAGGRRGRWPRGEKPRFRRDVTLRLEQRADLFSPPALDEFGGAANLISGVEQLVGDLVAARPVGELHGTIELPADEAAEAREEEVSAAIARYCDARIATLDRDRAALRSEGLGALVLSVPLLLVTLGLIVALQESGIGSFWRAFLGDVLLVLSWVALWYPLDTLIWYARPVSHELRVLRAMRTMPVTIRAVDPVTPTPAGARAAPRAG